MVPESTEPTTRALVNGEALEVPISRILLDPGALQSGDVDGAYGALYLLRNGDLNREFIPCLFPRGDGIFVWQGLIQRS
jgi:hypothetical protein